MRNFWDDFRFQNIFYLLNSVFVFWYFSFSLLGNKSPAILSLALMALVTLSSLLKGVAPVWNAHKLWILALLIYSVFNMASMFVHGVDDSAYYERPAKALGAAVVFVYLIKYGFSKRAVAIGVLVSVAVGAFYAIYEKFYLGLARAGTVTHPIRFGYLLLTLSLLCAFFAYYFKGSKVRYLCVLLALLGLFGAYCTGTRGILVILFFVVFGGAIALVREKRLGLAYVAMPILLSVIFCVFLVAKVGGIDRYVDRTVAEVEAIADGNLNNSIGTRIQLWHVALYLGIKEPFWGVGYDYEEIRSLAEDFVLNHGYNPSILVKYRHFHNEYLDRFAKQGVLGVIVWCFLLVAAVSGMRSHYRYAVFIIVSTLAVGGLTETVSNSSRLFYLAILGISVFRCLDFFEQNKSLAGCSCSRRA